MLRLRRPTPSNEVIFDGALHPGAWFGDVLSENGAAEKDQEEYGKHTAHPGTSILRCG
jgi:hypothetical protein